MTGESNADGAVAGSTALRSTGRSRAARRTGADAVTDPRTSHKANSYDVRTLPSASSNLAQLGFSATHPLKSP